MKIFKLFVCLSLILSISLINSFAAISVSDGSAFVTKAEFAADLNNLSNRMSTLENSLDAKIDSLVSSYLSRNGIWNGESQTKIASTIYLGSSIKFGSDYNDMACPMVLNQKLIEATKSGLARLSISTNKRTFLSDEYSVGSTATGFASVILFFTKKTENMFRVNTWTNAFYAYNILNNSLSSWKFADISETINSSRVVYIAMGRSAFKEYIYFFIEKGDVLYNNVVFIGVALGQPLKNRTWSWALGNNTLEYDLVIY